MEEDLRDYFLKSGYYVVRGVPVTYDGFDVTDVDLWLYARNSPLSRDISIVDIKNKKTPQAIERIFWVHGLKTVVNAKNAIVATTEKRASVKEFGRNLGVLVLDGYFLSKLQNASKSTSKRLSEEEFCCEVTSYELQKIDGDWKGILDKAKGLLVKGLSFDTCNELIEYARFFAEQILIKSSSRHTALRCFLLICSYLSICLDFIQQEYSHLDLEERKKALFNGITYGSMGKDGLDKVLALSEGLLHQYVQDGQSTFNQMKTNLEDSFHQMQTNILAEYFSRHDVSVSLFTVGKEFENLSKSKAISGTGGSSVELRSFIACLCDYWEIDRSSFIPLIS
ncbi:hypothetical protein FJ709_13685 [Shewanella glacialimarina]|nr:hypothetical protein FJ709_13685 [Shewanella glacialimarina]